LHEVRAAAVPVQVPRQAQPHVDGVWEVKAGRHDADDFELPAVLEIAQAADHLRVGLIALAPEAIAADGDGAAAIERTLREAGTELRPDAEDLEEIGARL